ncbi:MAG: zinc-dependent metalloprotease, partial [Burkholderiales bacterium]
VARIVGGVEETRYQAGYGKAPFAPVDPDRQREAAKFLLKRAFIEPKALLDPDVLRRITPSGGADPLHGSNVELLRRLIDPAVFQRMLEASSVGKGRYTGLELLSDLNDGLFSELGMKSPVVSPYRRQVQRSYVTVLLTATGTIDDPSQSANIDSANLDNEHADSGSERKSKSNLSTTRSFDSELASVGQQFSGGADALSEYRAALRAAVSELYKKIGEALDRTTDTDTLLHLRLIRSQLANVS